MIVSVRLAASAFGSGLSTERSVALATFEYLMYLCERGFTSIQLLSSRTFDDVFLVFGFRAP